MPKRKWIELLGSMFNDPESSDLIVVAKDDETAEEEEFHVSKLLLKVKSEVFFAALSGDWKESQEGKIVVSFPAHIVKVFLRHLYKLNWSDSAEIDPKTNGQFLLHAQVFAIADYYQVLDLKIIAAKRLAAAFDSYPKTSSDPFLADNEDFHRMVDYVYTSISDASAGPIRAKLVSSVIGHMSQNGKSQPDIIDAAMDILTKNRQFLFDIITKFSSRLDVTDDKYIPKRCFHCCDDMPMVIRRRFVPRTDRCPLCQSVLEEHRSVEAGQ